MPIHEEMIVMIKRSVIEMIKKFKTPIGPVEKLLNLVSKEELLSEESQDLLAQIVQYISYSNL